MKRLATLLALALPLLACGKPQLKEHCVMNGWGHGTCTFTNTGTATGTMCGRIIVTNKYEPTEMPPESSVLCSGDVAKASTGTVSFSIPSVQEYCSSWQRRGLSKWGDVCDFEWIAYVDENTDALRRVAAREAAWKAKGE